MPKPHTIPVNLISLGCNYANTVGFGGLVPLLLHLCPLSVLEGWVCRVFAESPRKWLFGTPRSACCTDDMFEIFVSFLDGAYVSCFLFLSRCSDHVHIQIRSTISRPKIKWLDFGMIPDPEKLQPHPGYVRVKSGCSKAIAWRKVQLTKQRNVDLTTDGLWAMPLNTGWVPVKARRLQDWEKLRKYVPIHKQGDVCPNGVPAGVDRGNNDDDSE